MSRSIATAEWNRAARLIQSSDAILIGTHIRPDGDALGSLLGLALALEKAGKRVARLCADPVPPVYSFLPGSDRVSDQPPRRPAQLGIAVDCDGIARLGPLETTFAALPHLLDIDHHATNRSFGEVRLTDPSAAACSEMVYHLIGQLGLPLDQETAICLYTGVITDTGRFCYANTTADTFRVAGELVRAGAAAHAIARKVYGERSLAATHLLGVALSRLTSELNGEVVSAWLTLSDFAETGAVSADTEGIIDHLRAIGGPRVALLLVEMEGGQVRVSLRSDGSVDVSDVAYGFGGGGHAAAAGCTCEGTMGEVRRQVLAALEQSLVGASPRYAR
jgi:phosphoesterase RecJ-like protein